MNMLDLLNEIEIFSSQNNGNSDYYKENVYVSGEKDGLFAPLSYLLKKVDGFSDSKDLMKDGYVHDSFDLFTGNQHLLNWYESNFSRKLKRTVAKNFTVLHLPNNKAIFDAIETVNKCYEVLTNEQIIINGKKLPVQLGEWYAKCIFGLTQRKSTSQRGFDFYIDDKRVEVKIHWGDHSSPKGVKVRKSLVELSDYCVVVYVARNFMIREICFLDSEFIMRKFSGKGHTIFLKDNEISQYFFSNSEKHTSKVVNRSALMKYSSPTLAMKIADRFTD